MQTLASKLIPVAIASILCGVAVAGGGKEDKLSMMDKDGDGKISAMEYAEGTRAMFGKMDTNQDGAVTEEEMDAAHASMGKGHSNEQSASRTEGPAEQRMGDKKAYDPSGTGKAMPKQMSSAQKIAAMDTNNDGKLTEQEHSAGAKKMFSKMDKDHDGSLTAQELREGERPSMTASDTD